MAKTKQRDVRIVVVIQEQFSALHCWPSCPFEDVAYLKNSHRHLFKAVLKFKVSENIDREIEFIRLKNKIHRYFEERFENKNIGSMSCEQIATILLKEFDACFVSVFEDGENGAEVRID